MTTDLTDSIRIELDGLIDALLALAAQVVDTDVTREEISDWLIDLSAQVQDLTAFLSSQQKGE